ncbi:MAG: hypothetical protein JO100_13195 [Pseudonocardia sp.]|nr:hypothetical protein [Pseudonocardia sp.]
MTEPGRPPYPGVIPLRPLGVGEILDGAVSYFRASPKATLGLSAVVVAFSQLIQVPLVYRLPDTRLGTTPSLTDAFSSDQVITIASGGILSYLVNTLLSGMLITVMARAVLGRRPTLAAAWSRIRPRLAGLFGVTLLVGLVIFAAMMVAVGPLIIGIGLGAPAVANVLSGLLFIPLGLCLVVFVSVSLSIATPAYVLEKISARAALGRSMRLVCPQWWRVFGILLLATILAWVIGAIIAFPFGVGAALISVIQGGDLRNLTLLALVILSVGTIVVRSITAPFAAGVVSLLYIDQRFRREALDLDLLNAVAQVAQPEPGGGASREAMAEPNEIDRVWLLAPSAPGPGWAMGYEPR